MDHEKLVDALVDALQDEQVIAALKGAIPEKKGTGPSNPDAEQELINNHIIFAKDEDDEDAVYMSAKEIKSAVEELLKERIDLRPRVFNRLLKEQAPLMTGTRSKKYLVSFIVEDAAQFTQEEQELENKEVDTERPPVDVDLLQEAVEDFNDLEEYREFLDSKSKKGLIKHINKYKMQVVCENRDEDEIVDAIIDFLVPYVGDDDEAPRVAGDDIEAVQDEDDKHEREEEEAEQEAVKEKSKKKKKDKKKKKKKKDVDLEKEDLQDLKKSKKKKGKKKKKK